MFTGIIQDIGTIESITTQSDAQQLRIATEKLDMQSVSVGDSIAVSGVCLTVTTFDQTGFWADVSKETLSRTIFGSLHKGDRVNLEKSLTLATPLGGHLVTGHVDGIGQVIEKKDIGEARFFRIETPMALAKYIAEKGSVCVDGVSLTVNGVDKNIFDLTIIPHTLSHTTFSTYVAGRSVNLEVDLIARYAERLLNFKEPITESKLDKEFLVQHGFVEE
jgi:riboflavin synthase